MIKQFIVSINIILFLSVIGVSAEQISSRSRNIVGLWHFNDGSGASIKDETKNSTSTIIGGIWVTGRIGSAIEFPNNMGAARGIDCGNAAAINIATNQITVAGWFYSTVLTTETAVTSVGINKGEIQYLLFWKSGTTLTYFWYTAGNFVTPRKATSTFYRKWVHCVGTYDGKKMKLYFDGVLDNEKNVTGNITPLSNYLCIGNYSKDFNAANNFYGKIDEVGIWNRALTSNEVMELYDSGKCRHIE